jgi:glycosyltransferase involved in cell wall biosynthesis
MHIVHFGSLSATKKVKRIGLFKTLKKLKDKGIINGNNFCLSFIGNINTLDKNIIARYNLNNIIDFIPYMDKNEGFRFITQQADYLLFYGVPNETTIISSKLLEYIKLNKPIMGICKGNEAELIIQKTGTGEVCDFDEDSIELLLIKVINREIYYKPDYTEISKFNRENQAKEVAHIIQSVYASAKA